MVTDVISQVMGKGSGIKKGGRWGGAVKAVTAEPTETVWELEAAAGAAAAAIEAKQAKFLAGVRHCLCLVMQPPLRLRQCLCLVLPPSSQLGQCLCLVLPPLSRLRQCLCLVLPPLSRLRQCFPLAALQVQRIVAGLNATGVQQRELMKAAFADQVR